jgi:amino acid permease
MGQGTRQARESVGQGIKRSEGPVMLVMRAWLWLVPAVMLVASVVFGTIAVLDGSWALVVVMVLMGVFALALFVLHWWLMYRFGSTRP